MPPRAVPERRSARVSARDVVADSSPTPALPSLQKPNLPKLQGTPSTRRQYTYGSSAEPPPARLGQRSRQGRPMDLTSAVGNALSRQNEEQESQMLPPPVPAVDESDQDELAGDVEPSPSKPQRTGYLSRRSRGPSAALDDAGRGISTAGENGTFDHRQFTLLTEDDGSPAPSFAIESDVYRDATIDSTLGATPIVAESGRNAASRRSRQVIELRNAAEGSPSDMSDDLASTNATSNLASDPPQSPDKPRPGRKAKTQTQLQTRQSRRPRDDVSEEVEEQLHQDIVTAQSSLKRGKSANTPLPARKQKQSAEPLAQAAQAEPTEPIYQAPPEGPIPREPPREEQRLRDQTERQPSQDLGQTRLQGQRDRPNVSIFSREPLDQSTKSVLKAGSLRPSHRPGRKNAATEALGDDEGEQRGPSRAQPVREKYTWIKAFSPRQSPRDDRSNWRDEDEDEEEQIHEPGSVGVWWLIKTITSPLLHIMDWITDRVLSTFGVITSHIRAVDGMKAWKSLLSIVFLVLSLWITWSSLRPFELESWSDLPDVYSHSTRGIGNMVQQISGYIHSIPSAFNSRGTTLADLWNLDEDGQQGVEEFLKRYEDEFNILKKAGKLHDASLTKLEKVVPKVVHMELKDGKPVIAQEFWHAVRDLIHDEKKFLTVEKKGRDYEFAPEQHWRAVALRLSKDPAFTSTLNVSLEGLEDRLDKKMTGFWDGWVKDNDDKVAQALGEALDKMKSAESDRELNARLQKLLKEQLREQPAAGTIVTRDEFLRHLKNEFATHRSEIRAELSELQPQLQKLIRDTVELARSKQPTPQSSMTREDITTLVNGLVRKAFADVNLEAMARGKIHAHWDIELKNQVNYFSIGAGAIIDPKYSSLTYDPMKKSVANDKVYERGIRGSYPLPPVAALAPWQDEGDCWCAARELNRRGNPHGATLSVLLGHQIIPQQVVLEHILPGATIDPGARPRDVEVHAYISDHEIRERVRDFSATHFPEPDAATDPDAAWNAMPAALPDRFVKIGQFVYEGAELHDGVHVHRLSSELVHLAAQTDHVIIRATSNYGGVDHTCFYRVRLFGQGTISSD